MSDIGLNKGGRLSNIFLNKCGSRLSDILLNKCKYKSRQFKR